MSLEIDLLRALFRSSRRTRPLSSATLAKRLGTTLTELEAALASLGRSGLVQPSATGPRLSLAGLAVAVAVASALGSPRVRAKRLPGVARMPLTRRRAA